MKTSLFSAAAIGCALALAGCQSVTPAKIELAFASAKVTAAKIASVAKTVDADVCHGIVPAAESVGAILAAADGTVATVEAAVGLACKALDVGVAYAAETGKPVPPRRPRKDEPVTGTAVVNGKPVAVTGTVAK